MKKTNEQIALRVSFNTLVINALLSTFELFAGFYAGSAAIISEAVNSYADVLSSIFVMIGIKLSNKAADKEHPYGHERFECVAAIILAAVLFATGIGIGLNGLNKIFAEKNSELTAPGILALIAALCSIIVKESMFWYTRKAAKKIDSSVLMADAWHHRSDTLSSIGSFAGVLGARLGLPILDPIACVVICGFILKAAIDIFRDAIGKMTDKACDEEIEIQIRDMILEQNSVVGVDRLNTRLFGDKIYVEVEISTEGTLTLNEAHDMAQQVHDTVEKNFPKVKHCMVHVNPAENS